MGVAVQGAPTFGAVPALGRRLLFVGTADGRLVALDASSGKTVWTAEAGGPVSGSVALAPDVVKDTTVVYVTSTRGALAAANAATGEILWRAVPDPGAAL